jgi:hypothetical protein
MPGLQIGKREDSLLIVSRSGRLVRMASVDGVRVDDDRDWGFIFYRMLCFAYEEAWI